MLLSAPPEPQLAAPRRRVDAAAAATKASVVRAYKSGAADKLHTTARARAAGSAATAAAAAAAAAVAVVAAAPALPTDDAERMREVARKALQHAGLEAEAAWRAEQTQRATVVRNDHRVQSMRNAAEQAAASAAEAIAAAAARSRETMREATRRAAQVVAAAEAAAAARVNAMLAHEEQAHSARRMSLYAAAHQARQSVLNAQAKATARAAAAAAAADRLHTQAATAGMHRHAEPVGANVQAEHGQQIHANGQTYALDHAAAQEAATEEVAALYDVVMGGGELASGGMGDGMGISHLDAEPGFESVSAGVDVDAFPDMRHDAGDHAWHMHPGADAGAHSLAHTHAEDGAAAAAPHSAFLAPGPALGVSEARVPRSRSGSASDGLATTARALDEDAGRSGVDAPAAVTSCRRRASAVSSDIAGTEAANAVPASELSVSSVSDGTGGATASGSAATTLVHPHRIGAGAKRGRGGNGSVQTATGSEVSHAVSDVAPAASAAPPRKRRGA